MCHNQYNFKVELVVQLWVSRDWYKVFIAIIETVVNCYYTFAIYKLSRFVLKKDSKISLSRHYIMYSHSTLKNKQTKIGINLIKRLITYQVLIYNDDDDVENICSISMMPVKMLKWCHYRVKRYSSLQERCRHCGTESTLW